LYFDGVVLCVLSYFVVIRRIIVLCQDLRKVVCCTVNIELRVGTAQVDAVSPLTWDVIGIILVDFRWLFE